MNIHIGDTPEQLGSCLTADAVMIDGKIITKQQISGLIIQNAELVAMVDVLRQANRDYKNNKISRYDFANRVMEALVKTPTQHLRDRDAEAGRAGFIAGAKYVCTSRELGYFPDVLELVSLDYVERVKAGEV